MCSEAERHSMLTARSQLFHELRSADHDITLLNRGPLSTWAYQVHGHDHATTASKQRYVANHEALPVTDLHNYILDIPLETSQERQRNTSKDRIEQRNNDYFHRVIHGYRNPPSLYDTTRFDATQEKDTLETTILQTFTADHLTPHTPDITVYDQ